jgi:hypothetical protein
MWQALVGVRHVQAIAATAVSAMLFKQIWMKKNKVLPVVNEANTSEVTTELKQLG